MSIFQRTIVFITILAYVAINYDTVSMAIIDTKNPIIIHENISEETFSSYFGYTLAFIKRNGTRSRSSATLKGGILYIGAPKENRTVKNSGVVWECDFGGDNAQLSCSIINKVSNRINSDSDERCSNSESLYYPEEVTDQWNGASLAVSQKNHYLISCAPRWKVNSWMGISNKCIKETALTGQCYYMALLTSRPKELKPFYPTTPRGRFYTIRDDWDDGARYEILYTQFGFSSHVSEQGNFFAGAPSAARGDGRIVHYKNIKNNPEIFGELKGYSWLGYSVTSGTTHGDFKDYVAVGAPRGGVNMTGVVHVYTLEHNLKHTYVGPHLGSYFGYALATVNLCGDGNDKLLVGAPTYTNAEEYNTGCVYIYDVSSLVPAPLKLCMDSGRVSKGARFGSAIVNLGDINFDSKEDFAVSAPYDGVGTVFIYHGNNSISNNPAQVISGKSIEIPIRYGFGTSLLGGKNVDVDGNGTPDLIVGSFFSGYVTVFRSRPIVKATVRVNFYGETNKDGISGEILRLPLNLSTFGVKICVELEFSISSRQIPSSLTLGAWMRYELDEIEKRIGFVDDRENQVVELKQLSPSQPTCFTKQLKPVKDIFYGNNKNPIRFQANVNFNQTELDNQPANNAYIQLTSLQIPNRQTGEYQSKYHGFNQYLPAPFTQSHTGNLEIIKDNCDSDGYPECVPELSLNLELFYQNADEDEKRQWTSGSSLIVGQLDSLFLSVKVLNKRETAYRPAVRVMFSLSKNYGMDPSLLQFKWQKTPGKEGECTPEKLQRKEGLANITQILLCSRPLHNGMENNYLLEIRNLRHLKLNMKQINGNLSLKVDTYQVGKIVNESKSLFLPLIGDLDINVTSSGHSAAQSPIDPESTNFICLTEYFVIKNSGFSSTGLYMVNAEVLIPTHLNMMGSSYTQVIGIADPSSNEGIRCHAVNSTFFELPNKSMGKVSKGELTSASMAKMNSKDSSIDPTMTDSSSLISSDNFITMSGCTGDDKSCQTLKCFMDLPSKGAREIKIQLYFIWETIGHLVPADVKGIRVESIATVFYMGDRMSEKAGKTQIEFISKKSIPIWIYGASGLGGTVLLLLLTFCLFKCGFFRRKEREKLKSLKRKTTMLRQQQQSMDPATLLELLEGLRINE